MLIELNFVYLIIIFQPAYAGVQEEPFDPALAALIALLVVLLVGAVTVTVVCCCLRHW